MCDTYIAPCEGGCRREINIHIADFCTSRDKVHAYCPRCSKKIPTDVFLKAAQVFTSRITRRGQVTPGSIRKDVGTECLILCDDPGAYGIELN